MSTLDIPAGTGLGREVGVPAAVWSPDGATESRSIERTQIAVAIGLAAAILAATAAGSSLGATLLGYVAVGVAVLAPPIGLGVVLLHAPFQELTGFGPLGFHGVLVAAILLGCVGGLARERQVVRIDLLWAIFLAFGGFALIQVLAIRADIFGVQQTFATVQLVGLATGGGVLLAAQLLLRTRDWAPYLDLIIISGVLAGSLAIASFVTNGGFNSVMPSLFALDANGERAIGPFNNPNYFGLFAVMTLIVAVHRASMGSVGRRLVTAGAGAVIFTSTILAFSRGALLAGAAGIIMLAFSRSVRLGVATTAICLLGGLVWSGAFAEARFSVTNPNQFIDDQLAAQALSDDARFSAGSVGFTLFSRDPVFGVGFGQYHFVSPFFLPPGSKAVYSHDWYVNVLAEQGIVGISLLISAAVVVLRRLSLSDPTRRALAVSILAAFAVGNVFTESPTYVATSAVAWFVVGAALARSKYKIGDIQRSLGARARRAPSRMTFRPPGDVGQTMDSNRLSDEPA